MTLGIIGSHDLRTCLRISSSIIDQIRQRAQASLAQWVATFGATIWEYFPGGVI